MAGTAIVESIPMMWDEARDNAFFRVTAGLFDTAFCLGSSVLLSSYDDECEQLTAATAVQQPVVAEPTAARPAAVR